MDTADHLRDASPWKSEPSAVKLAILGKLVEESGELIAAAARCIIQGVDGKHPVTGKPNLEWLLEEMADVQNMLNVAQDYTQHDTNEYADRIARKRAHIYQWLASLV